MKMLVALLVFISFSSFAQDTCLSTREYITTLRYLEDKKEFQVSRENARKIADEISLNCTGSAERFIRVMEILVRADMDIKTSLSTSAKLSKDASTTAAFVQIFKSSFIEKMLDQDAKTSYKVAMNFATDFKGDLTSASSAFFAVARYCSEEGKMELPRARCLESADKIGKISGEFKSDLSVNFFKLIEFLMNSKEANLPLFKALEEAEKITRFGPLATSNFIEAYQFAASKKDLGLSTAEAIIFAEKMAERSIKFSSSDNVQK